MAHWRKLLVAGIGALSLLVAGTVSVGASPADRLLQFDSMTPVTGAALGPATDRGIPGGGLPWAITSGRGSVDRQGHVSVTVTGVVLVVSGKNPITPFEAVVSCITPDGIMNVETGPSPANGAGDSTINATVDLPHPCKDPVVFVGGSPRGSFIWFAKSNAEG